MIDILVEIGVEELPAVPFLKELPNINSKWQKACEEAGLKGDFKLSYTPRRIVISGKISKKADDISIENIGAPKAVALNGDGNWSAAAISFAKKCGIELNELKFAEIKGKEVLYHSAIKPGKNSSELIAGVIESFMSSLHFGKSMRWGSGEYEFIRPIRSLFCLLDEKGVDFELFGVKSKLAFYPHRFFGYEPVCFNSASEYFTLLAQNGVILDPNMRREKILNEFKQIENNSGLKIELDEDLLNEVIAITESPSALLGGFEEEFLAVAPEVIITSMKENQRYFPLHDTNGKLANKFVVVSNAITDDPALIVRGNEKVLRARLSDAKFFWDSDLRGEFSANKLKNIHYLDGLGSVYDKELREREVARSLAKIYKNELLSEYGDGVEEALDRAVMLSKADLTTAVVYEFTDLQGIMGGYYAAYKKEHPLIVRAIKEQYQPVGENGACPNGIFASIVALSSKIDTLMGLFSINKIPSGNKDPYALRRAAAGIIKIAFNLNINFNLNEILDGLKEHYNSFDLTALKSFIFDRLYGFYDINSSIIKACINAGNSDLKALNANILALDKLAKSSDFELNFATFKRLANILKDAKIGDLDEKILNEPSEIALNEAFKKAINGDGDGDPYRYLEAIFAIKPQIDAFFDSVMINADDEKIKQNRIALIGQIYNAILKIADIKEITS